MVQILPAVQRNHLGTRFGQSLGTNLGEGFSEGMKKASEKKAAADALNKENEALKQSGIDISGIVDPKMRQLYVSAQLQGANAQQLQAIKEQEKNQRVEKSQQFVEGIYHRLSGKQSKGDQLSSGKPTDQVKDDSGFSSRNPMADISDEEIAQATVIDPNLGRTLQSQKDVALRESREERALKEKKLIREDAAFDRAYKAQEDFINETTKSYRGFETETKPRLLQMQNIPDEDIVTPTKSVFLEAMGIPLGALEHPGSELYNKLSLDLLKGLPETYGNRILKVEVDNFLKTIPTLLNSSDGRRMISSNMLKLGEMKEVYYNEMRRQQRDSLDTGNKLPKDFQQNIFDQVKPQIDRTNNEFVKMSEITSVPQGTAPYFAKDGNIYFVPKNEQGNALIEKEGLKKIW